MQINELLLLMCMFGCILKLAVGTSARAGHRLVNERTGKNGSRRRLSFGNETRLGVEFHAMANRLSLMQALIAEVG